MQIQVPSIDLAALTPNPVSINTALKVSIKVSEKTITLEAEYPNSGEIYSGETEYL